MRYFTILIILIFSTSHCIGQIHEIGIFAGGTNFIGDIGSSRYIAPNKTAFGGIYKWNRSPRHTLRISLIIADIEGMDSQSDDPRRKQRNYSFKNNFIELSGGIEFTFLDFNLHEEGNKSTPYLYTGISFATFDNYYFNNSGIRINENTKSNAFGIPMVLGFKTTITEKLIFAVEVGARYTSTDELDGSIPDSKPLRENLSFGNTNNNDWYVFTGATLTYTFGRKPCYCNF
ncbi:MAG: hypothetical protein HKO81_10290 [Flavobacteriaceae bacterium]|nr:hypothetical protein [Flavobacteriaceae bacterium]